MLGSHRKKDEADLIAQQEGEVQIESVAGPTSDPNVMWMSTALSIDHKPDRKDEYD